MSQVDAAPTLRRLRHRRRRHVPQCNLPARRDRRRVAEVHRSSPPAPRATNTDWNNFAPNVGVAWRPNVQGGWLRTLLGDPDQATLRGGYSIAYDAPGHGQSSPAVYGANPGSTLSLTRNEPTAASCPPGETWPVLLSQTEPPLQRAVPARPPMLPDRASGPNRADSLERLRAGHQGGVGAVLDRQLPALDVAATWRSTSATSARAASTSGRTLNYNEREHHRERLHRRVPARDGQPAGEQRLRRRARRIVRLLRRRAPAQSPLPIYLAYINGSRDAGNRRGLHAARNWTQHARSPARLVAANPDPTARRRPISTATRRAAQRDRRRPAGELLRPEPGRRQVNVTDSGAFSDYHALQIELRRRLSHGLQVNGSYQYALEGGSAFLGFHYRARMLDPTANVRHAIKTQWDLDAAGRPRPALRRNMNPVARRACSAAGSSTASAASRPAR